MPRGPKGEKRPADVIGNFSRLLEAKPNRRPNWIAGYLEDQCELPSVTALNMARGLLRELTYTFHLARQKDEWRDRPALET